MAPSRNNSAKVRITDQDGKQTLDLMMLQKQVNSKNINLNLKDLTSPSDADAKTKVHFGGHTELK